jgi:hypothetical protein
MVSFHNPPPLFNSTHIDFHLAIQAIVEKEIVGHSNAMRFHGMTLAVVVIAHIT